MEEDEDGQQPMTPFWLQNTTFRQSNSRSGRRGEPIAAAAAASSLLFNSTSCIVVLVIAAGLIFIFYLIPSILNFTSQVFKPNSVKRSWDSLNLVLVLFAIICAFLGKTNSNESQSQTSTPSRFRSPASSFNRGGREQWYGEHSDRSGSSTGMRLRSSSSYPDLRNQDSASTSSWVYSDFTDKNNRYGNYNSNSSSYKFSDDTHVPSYQFSDSDWQIRPGRKSQAAVEDQEEVDDGSINRENWTNNSYRFSDDTQVRSYQFPKPDWRGCAPGQGNPVSVIEEFKDGNVEINKVLIVENAAETANEVLEASASGVKVTSSQPSPLPHPAPPQPAVAPFVPHPSQQQTAQKLKSRRTYRAVERAEAQEEVEADKEQKPKTKPPSPPTPPPPPSPKTATTATTKRKSKRTQRSFDKEEAPETRYEDLQQQETAAVLPSHTDESDLRRSSDRKRGGATKEFLSAFYSKKKKRERQRSVENLDHILNPPSSSSATPIPPPPPPPPPQSVFQNLFSSKKEKGKRSASSSDLMKSAQSRVRNPKTQIAITQPPIQSPVTKRTTYTNRNQHWGHNGGRGSESPLYGIPAPPPPPPFGMPVWKFAVEGDYVRLRSMNSSRSGSPEPYDDREESFRDSSVNEESMRSEEEESAPSSPAVMPAGFCPSPDVNTKADNFIARFRAGLKLEKMNSGNGVGPSRLGPSG